MSADASDGTARAIAAQILRYRRDGEKIAADAPLWQIGSEETADVISDLVAEEMSEPVAGWKLGAIDEQGRQRLQLSKPFIGRVFASRLWRSPATLSRLLLPECIPESELAFRLRRDLPARSDAYGLDEVTDAIDACHVAFEIVDFSWPDRSRLGGRDFVADNGGCAGLVVGTAIADWPEKDLATEEFELRIDDRVVARGFAKSLDVLLDRVTWLANHLSQRGIGMKAGQFVATGNWTGMTPMRAGQPAIARFGALGTVECVLPEA